MDVYSEVLRVAAADTNTIKDIVLRGERPRMDLIPADVPDILKQIISRCWAPRPDDRPFFSGEQ